MSTPTKEKRNICSSPVEKDILLLCKEKATESENYGNKFRVRHLYKSLARTSRSPSYRPSRVLSNFLKRALFFKLFYGKWAVLLVEKTPRLRLATLRHFLDLVYPIVHFADTLIYLIHLRGYFKSVTENLETLIKMVSCFSKLVKEASLTFYRKLAVGDAYLRVWIHLCLPI